MIGTLVMSSYATDDYGPEDVALAESIASQISGAVANAQLFAELTRMADALRESEASINSIFRVAPIGIGVVDALWGSEAPLNSVLRAAPDGMGAGYERILGRVNDRMCEMLGYDAQELTGKSARLLYPTDEDFDYVGREKYIQIREKGTGSVETRWRRKDGTAIDVLLTSTPIDPSDLSRGVTFTALDITESKRAEQERRSLEERLRQAQKMEAIGTLAGGIAHDFNNILAAIIGFAELARMEASGQAELLSSLSGVLKASFRARDLVRQILTFSRQAEAEFIPVQAHLIVKETIKLLRASLPATIHVRQSITSHATIMGDPIQIQQVVMNLCTNAYHAMREEGGDLDVGLSEVLVDGCLQPELQDLRPGRHLRLSVRDTGPGIDPGVIQRIFDPYFTTKEKTKGTGLGLAVVHGVVNSHKGAIQVSSRLGAGTTFDVYFPIVDEAVERASPEKEAAVAGGRERILFRPRADSVCRRRARHRGAGSAAVGQPGVRGGHPPQQRRGPGSVPHRPGALRPCRHGHDDARHDGRPDGRGDDGRAARPSRHPVHGVQRAGQHREGAGDRDSGAADEAVSEERGRPGDPRSSGPPLKPCPHSNAAPAAGWGHSGIQPAGTSPNSNSPRSTTTAPSDALATRQSARPAPQDHISVSMGVPA